MDIGKNRDSTILIIAKTKIMDADANTVVTENSTFFINSSELLITETHQTLVSSEAEEIGRILKLVIRPILIVFGTIGNSLSFYIMRQGSMKHMSTCFYLSIIAMADTSKCLGFCFGNQK